MSGGVSGNRTKNKALVAAWAGKGCSDGAECADRCGSAGASAAAGAVKDGAMSADNETRSERHDQRVASGIVTMREMRVHEAGSTDETLAPAREEETLEPLEGPMKASL